MYKIKDVSQMTGLTEKAIRLYMEQKLVEPKVEDGIHRKAYYFEEKDVERLKDIAALRSAGFGISDIKMMLEDSTIIPELIEEKESLLAMEIEQKLSVQKALKNLTIQEQGDISKLADAIEPRSTYAKETRRTRMTRGTKWLIVIAIFVVGMIFSVLRAGTIVLQAYTMSFSFTFGLIAIIMGIIYFLYGVKRKKAKRKGTGKIVATVMNTNIEDYIGEDDKGTLNEVGTFLMVGFLGEIWKRLRPDCWHPVIRYQTEDGAYHTGTVKHGAFKNSWKIGEEVEITWEDGKGNLLYLCNNKVLYRKACAYLIPGVLMFTLSMIMLFGQLQRIGLI